MALFSGCIGDDHTGSSDLATTLVKNSLSTVQLISVPDAQTLAPNADTIVIVLKSRTKPSTEAIRYSLLAAKWLKNERSKDTLPMP